MASARHIPVLPAEEYERQQRRLHSRHGALWDILDRVKDPEIPVVSIWELGVLQDVVMEEAVIEEEAGRDTVVVTITPTYSGCPAMDVIAEDIGSALEQAGYPQFRIVSRLAPAWSTTWMSSAARDKLRAYGIAPPAGGDGKKTISCPQCGSGEVSEISEFGSTACKALYRCDSCAEPFDHFKSI